MFDFIFETIFETEQSKLNQSFEYIWVILLQKWIKIRYFDPVSAVFIRFSSSFHCLVRNDSAILQAESN